jgi:uncharacterized protein YciI
MLYVIHALDKDGALPVRLAHYDEHKAFLADTSQYGVNIVMSGPLVSDDGATMIGSLFLVDAPDRDAVVRFNAADPFARAELWASLAITAFMRRQG